MKRILVTGAAGFIGFHTSLALKDFADVELVLVDSLQPAFPTSMTSIRNDLLHKSGSVIEIVNIAKSSPSELKSLFGRVDLVIHLAASPGVRVPKGSELTYFENNVLGFTNILNFSALLGIPLIYASSSSVYGDKGIDGPVSEASMDTYTGRGIYALAKWTNEEVSRIYYQNGYVKSVGLRFFSVYGKYGRPDMAYFSFTRKILGDIPIRIFGSHKFQRDFTPIKYVLDDMLFLVRKILDGDNKILDQILEYDGANTLNIGTGRPVSVETLLKTIEKKLLKDAVVEIGEIIPEESTGTWSDNRKRNFFLPQRLELDFEETIGDFVEWYRHEE
jgi:UDP-glucuronate 4-epimerase